MLEVQPTSFCPVDSRVGATPWQTETDAGAISTSLREASFVSRPWVARDIVAGMDDAQLAGLAQQDRKSASQVEEGTLGLAHLFFSVGGVGFASP